MKYIDAERLRAKIEKYLTFDNNIDTAYYIGRRDAERSILELIDSLQQEQPAPYDEAYLNEKIAKATKSWEGVDVDKFIDEVRGREPEVDIKKIIEQTYHDGSVADTDDMDHVTFENIAHHFYVLGLNARKEENK